ncbi:type IV secretion system protein [soil metagenome]
MADSCPVPVPGDPLVQGLLGTTDCHVQALVRTGYGSLFESAGPFSAVLTILLTLYVAFIGYRLLLGRSQLSISDMALTVVKLAAVLALATQWGTYQTVVYRSLFDGPQQVADSVLHGMRSGGATASGDVFTGLQRAYDDMTAFSPAAPPGGPTAATAPAVPPGLAAASPIASTLPPQPSALLSKSGFDSLVLLSSAAVLLLSSLGVLLAAKIVLGMLLATGPIFIAFLLFDATRGLFEGWLRASLGFALAPLSVTLLLSLALTILSSSLEALETMRETNTYVPGVAYTVLIVVLVFAGVAGGMMLAAAVIAGGLKLPWNRPAAARSSGASPADREAPVLAEPGRAAHTASAAYAQERRDSAVFARSGAAALSGAGADSSDRRTVITSAGPDRSSREPVIVEARLGQAPRRTARPIAARQGTRGAGA